MIKNNLDFGVYTPPQCRIITVKVSKVLCDSANGSSPNIIYDDDPFVLS